MRRIVIAGGSVAAATAAGRLRARGFEGGIAILSAESSAPYTRVPLSKSVVTGETSVDELELHLAEDVEFHHSSPAIAIELGRRVVRTTVDEHPFDGLVIAAGARARRLAPRGVSGERVLRDQGDAVTLAKDAAFATTAVIVGAGFLGMELASTLTRLGVQVTLVDFTPPLERLLGPWLAQTMWTRASECGARFVRAARTVELVSDPVAAVRVDDRYLEADIIVTAAGDVPNTEWLSSGDLAPWVTPVGLEVDGCARVPGADCVTAAGDITAVGRGADARRRPHWTNAVEQAQAAADALLDPAGVAPYRPCPYVWTEQWGLAAKFSGALPFTGDVESLLPEDARPGEHEFLLRWPGQGIAAINHRISLPRFQRLAEMDTSNAL